MFLFQKAALCRCNIFPVVVAHVVEGMTHNLRPTCAEATDGANVVLDGWLLIPTVVVISFVKQNRSIS